MVIKDISIDAINRDKKTVVLSIPMFPNGTGGGLNFVELLFMTKGELDKFKKLQSKRLKITIEEDA